MAACFARRRVWAFGRLFLGEAFFWGGRAASTFGAFEMFGTFEMFETFGAFEMFGTFGLFAQGERESFAGKKERVKKPFASNGRAFKRERKRDRRARRSKTLK